jgi:elongator complex protein 3
MKDVTEAFQISRDAGFKIAAHMMPGLPGSSPSKDLEDFRRLFGDEQFKPDMLKIYPTLVVPGTALERLYKLGKYSPYSLEDTVNLLVEVKRLVPPWVRIMRIQREISAEEITSGVKAGNLRELVLKAMSQRGYSCNCMRCKEIGLRSNTTNTGLIKSNLKLSRTSYPASNGTEYFLSFEEPKNSALVGFLRLRIPSNRAHRPEINFRHPRASCIRLCTRLWGSR